MKQTISIFIFLMIGINSFAQFEFEIEGKILGKEKGTLMFIELYALLGEQIEIPFENGEFHYKGEENESKFYFLCYYDTTAGLGLPSRIIVGPGKTEIEIQFNGSDIEIRFISPNEMNRLLQKYLDCNKFFNDSISKISDQVDKTQLYSQKADSMYNLSIANANNILSLYILYHHRETFSDLQINNVILEIDSTFKTSEYFKKVNSEFVGKSFNNVGDIARDFTLKDTTGTNITLSEVVKQNNYVLMEFWGTWCGPCIKKFRTIKPVYEKYKSKGFEIFSIALEKKRDRWIQVVDREGYKWINVIELEYDKTNEYLISNFYNILEYPNNILLDRDMKIIARGISNEELEKLLNQLK